MGYNRTTDSYHSRGDGLPSSWLQDHSRGDGLSSPWLADTETTAVECPYCHSTDTEVFSLFGQQLLTVEYYCNACHTPFERIKDDDVLDDFAARKEDSL